MLDEYLGKTLGDVFLAELAKGADTGLSQADDQMVRDLLLNGVSQQDIRKRTGRTYVYTETRVRRAEAYVLRNIIPQGARVRIPQGGWNEYYPSRFATVESIDDYRVSVVLDEPKIIYDLPRDEDPGDLRHASFIPRRVVLVDEAIPEPKPSHLPSQADLADVLARVTYYHMRLLDTSIPTATAQYLLRDLQADLMARIQTSQPADDGDDH